MDDNSCMEGIERRLAPVLRRAGVRFAYWWGSRARGRARADSDWDLAVSLPEASSDVDRFLDLVDELCVRLETDEVDVTLLEDAVPSVRFFVQHTGRLIYEADPSARVAFELKARKEFWDLEFLLRPHVNAVWKRVKDGTFGR